MNELYLSYLALLDGLSNDLEKLTALAREQSQAVRRDDLTALSDVMKREQVVALSLRGQEQKRQKLVTQLGLEGTLLAALPDRFPKELYPRAKDSADRLYRVYGVYRAAAEAARHTLEINLHEIEKVLKANGVDPAQGTGYQSPDLQPPKNMKTDFRA